ncbi:MAG: hypothetical protein ACJ0GJ_02295 [Candidatus Actinomarina sp.]|jgi:hypothetical protein|tara:strand:- start:570 stop:1811 length:1242 start_codon:yes stop_codon:yes gene_type:complete
MKNPILIGYIIKFMKKFVIFILFLSYCGGASDSQQTLEQPESNQATQESESNGATQQSESNEVKQNEEEIIDHMTLVDYPAKLYFAGDIPTEVHGRAEYAFSIIQEKLGKYPVEIYFVGTDESEKDNLSNLFCTNREEAGNFDPNELRFNFRDFDDCMNFIDERYFSEYLRSGLETEQRGYQASGNKGHNGQFEQRYHLLVWSKPIGFEVENGEGYNIEFRGVLHEYWHVFQMAHMDFYTCSDKDVRSTCSFDFDSIDYLVGGTWLQEGTAVFKEITILQEQIKIGNLKNIQGDIFQEFNNQYFDGQRVMEQCPGMSIRDITYRDPCSQAVYGWGAWAAAYLTHKVNDPYIFENVYYPELKKLGDPEIVFANTFGMTRDEFFAEFDSWIYLSEDERKIVIPTVEENTGRLYYP